MSFPVVQCCRPFPDGLRLGWKQPEGVRFPGHRGLLLLANYKKVESFCVPFAQLSLTLIFINAKKFSTVPHEELKCRFYLGFLGFFTDAFFLSHSPAGDTMLRPLIISA